MAFARRNQELELVMEPTSTAGGTGNSDNSHCDEMFRSRNDPHCAEAFVPPSHWSERDTARFFDEMARRHRDALDNGQHYFEHSNRISGPSISDCTFDAAIAVAFAVNVRRPGVNPFEHCLTWPEFVEVIRKPRIIADKVQGHLFSCCVYDGPELYEVWYGGQPTRRVRRAAKNLRWATLMAFDYDNGDVDFALICQRLRELGLTAFVYTTHSHSEEITKLRVLIPLRRPADVSDIEKRQHWRSAYHAIAEMIGVGTIDVHCTDPNRLSYPPMHKDGAPFLSEFIDGEPLDFDEIKVPVRERPLQRLRTGVSQTDQAEVASALEVIPASCSRKEWLTVLFALQSEWGDDAFEMFDAWSQSYPDKYCEKDLIASWDAADPDGGVTMGSFWRLAEQYGFDRRQYGVQLADALRKRFRLGAQS